MRTRYVVRHGRRIAVETLDTGAKLSNARRREAELFTKVPLQWAAAAAKATKTSKALVWLLLRHMAWQTKSSTFPFPNGMLRRHGVARETKRRALTELEAAGLIFVRRRHGRSSIVTLIEE